MIAKPILFICAHLPPRYQGGAEIYSHWLITALLEARRSVIVLSIDDFSRSLAEGQEVSVTPIGTAVFYRLSIDAEYMETEEAYFFNRSVFLQVNRLIETHRPAVVHIQGGFRITCAASIAAQNKGVRTIVTLHDFYYVCPKVNLWTWNGENCTGEVPPSHCTDCVSRKSRLTDDVMADWMLSVHASAQDEDRLATQLVRNRQTLEGCDLVLSPSEYLMSTHQRLGIRTKMLVNRIGVPRSYRGSRRNDGAKAGPLKIGYVGHLHPHKGVHVLLDALALLSVHQNDLVAVIHGDVEAGSKYHNELMGRAKDLPNAEFAGRYAFSDIPRVLNGLDAVVVPSLWQENSPLVILLAQRFHIPVICSNLGGMAEFVRNADNGIVVNAGEPAALAEALQAIVSDRAMLERLGTNSTYGLTTESEAEAILSYYDQA